MTRQHILYGLPHSLYTGPARAYLRKQRVDFVERSPRDPEFVGHVLPAIGRSNWLGKRITFADLPEDCQKVVIADYTELWQLGAEEVKP